MPTARIISTTAWYMGDFKRDLFWAWVWKPRFKVITTGGELSGIAVTYMWDYFGSCFWKDYRHVQRGNAQLEQLVTVALIVSPFQSHHFKRIGVL